MHQRGACLSGETVHGLEPIGREAPRIGEPRATTFPGALRTDGFIGKRGEENFGRA